MNYEDMTVEQINKSVTMALGKFKASDYSKASGNYHKGNVLDCNYSVGVVHDYCNDWYYGGLIIKNANISINPKSNCDYEIGICQFTGEWSACAFSSCDGEFGMSEDIIECTNENPLRAAMIVYLMMQEQK